MTPITEDLIKTREIQGRQETHSSRKALPEKGKFREAWEDAGKEEDALKNLLRFLEEENIFAAEEAAKERIAAAILLQNQESLLREDEVAAVDTSLVGLPIASLSPATIPAPAPVYSAAPVALPSDLQALFEKMAGQMIVLTSSGETETTLFLDAPQFSSSLFYGTRITIKEFSTAPKAFNVEIAASNTALACIQMHQAELLHAFHKGNFNFSIGRLETEIHNDERPVFQRKESVSEEDDRQEGGSPQ